MNKKMKLSDIKIKESFAATTPREEKMKKCRNYWNTYHHQDRWIVVDNDNELIDGYIMYLVLKENGIDEANVKTSNRYRKNGKDLIIPYYRNEETTYIYGVHPNSTKELLWRVPKNWISFAKNIQIGDSILCGTKFGISPIIVTRIEVLDNCPVDFAVKKVAGKEIRRNGHTVVV